MHDGCTGPEAGGQAIVDKVRMMGFAKMPIPAAMELTCTNCEKPFAMTHFETACPECGMVYGVTPCSAGNPSAVQAAGVGY